MNDNGSMVVALRTGDPQAARALWIRFAPLVFRTLRRIVGAGPDNEDLAQEVFLTVLQHAHKVRDPNALTSFIRSVAAFIARAAVRRRSRRMDILLREAPRGVVVTTDVDGREALLRFARILVRLPPQERSAFALRFIEGQGFSEMASALGVSLATVKRRVKRARHRITFLAERDPILRRYLTTSSPVRNEATPDRGTAYP